MVSCARPHKLCTVVTSTCTGYGGAVGPYPQTPRNICFSMGISLFRSRHTSSASWQRISHMNSPTRVSRHMAEQLESTRTLTLSHSSYWHVQTAQGVCKSLWLFLAHHAQALLITKKLTAFKLSIGKMFCHLLRLLSSWATPSLPLARSL